MRSSIITSSGPSSSSTMLNTQSSYSVRMKLKLTKVAQIADLDRNGSIEFVRFQRKFFCECITLGK